MEAAAPSSGRVATAASKQPRGASRVHVCPGQLTGTSRHRLHRSSAVRTEARRYVRASSPTREPRAVVPREDSSGVGHGLAASPSRRRLPRRAPPTIHPDLAPRPAPLTATVTATGANAGGRGGPPQDPVQRQGRGIIRSLALLPYSTSPDQTSGEGRREPGPEAEESGARPGQRSGLSRPDPTRSTWLGLVASATGSPCLRSSRCPLPDRRRRPARSR